MGQGRGSGSLFGVCLSAGYEMGMPAASIMLACNWVFS